MEFKQEELNIEKKYLDEAEVRALISTSMLNQTEPQRVQSGYIQSGNYASGTGWKLTSTEAIFPAITVTGGTIKYNKTSFTDSTHAGYYMGSEGIYFGAASDASKLQYNISTGAFDFIGTVSSRSTLTLANSINASGNLVTDIINVKLDTSAKKILSDFTFGSTDYSGAFKTGDITWNTTTGAITGGSGGLFNKNGLIFANNGVATITLDGVTGSATFSGTLSAASGTIGTINLSSNGYIGGGQTAFKTGDGVFLGYDTTPELDQWATPDTESDYSFANGSVSLIGAYFNISSSTSTIKKISVKLRVASGTSGDIVCDIYAAGSNFLPTGDSLGNTTISGISNTAYEVKDFIFSTPVSVTGGNDYVAVFSSTTTTPAILMAYSAHISGNTTAIRVEYYDGSWHAPDINDFPYLRVYSYNAGYKLSTGNSSYSLSYNGANLQTYGTLELRGSNSDGYADISQYGLDVYQQGIRTFAVNHTEGMLLRDPATTSRTSTNIFQIGRLAGTPYGYATGKGIYITNGANTNGGLAIWSHDGNAIRIDSYPASHPLVIGGMGALEIGSSGHKATVYCSGLSACPLPSVDSALSKFDSIPEPKIKDDLQNPDLAHFEFDKTKTLKKGEGVPQRKYFDIEDVPDELTFINDVGEKDIELIRVIGFLFKAVKELNTKIKTLEK